MLREGAVPASSGTRLGPWGGIHRRHKADCVRREVCMCAAWGTLGCTFDMGCTVFGVQCSHRFSSHTCTMFCTSVGTFLSFLNAATRATILLVRAFMGLLGALSLAQVPCVKAHKVSLWCSCACPSLVLGLSLHDAVGSSAYHSHFFSLILLELQC